MHKINLLPWREQALRKAKHNAVWMIIVLALSMLILVLTFNHFKQLISTQQQSQQTQIKAMRQQLQTLNSLQQKLHISVQNHQPKMKALRRIFNLTDQLLLKLPLKHGYLQKVILNGNQTKLLTILNISGNLSHKSQFAPLRQYIEEFFKKSGWQINTKLIEFTQSSNDENHFILEISFLKSNLKTLMQKNTAPIQENKKAPSL